MKLIKIKLMLIEMFKCLISNRILNYKKKNKRSKKNKINYKK